MDIYSVMNFITSYNGSSLTDEASSYCISQKVTKYKPDVKSVNSDSEAEVLLITHIERSNRAFC